jgi:hypothetical protein
VAEVRVREELERSAAGAALEVMFNQVGWPRSAEEVLQRTSALDDAQFAVIYGIQKPAGEFEIFARLVEAEALREPVALRACRHCLSVPLSPIVGSRAEGVWVMLP